MSSYDPFEDWLRSVLQAEAQTITPAGDGLSQIRTKVARRRDRLRWLRPGLAVATAAALGGAAVFAAALNEESHRTLKQDRVPATQPPSIAPTPSPPAPTPTRSAGPAVGRTAYTVWPFTSLPQAQAWQRSSGSKPSYQDPVQTALGFMGFVQAPEVDTVLKDETETTSIGAGRKVTLGRGMADGSVRPVTVVHLVRLGSGSTAPYAVTVAGGPQSLRITSPEIAAPVRSPLLVSGLVTGVDESVRVELRTLGTTAPISTPTSAPGGSGKPWRVSVPFAAPTSGLATLVARTDSAAGDGATQIAARPVLVSAGTARPASYPATFAAAVQGRIGVFDSATGQLVRYLTSAQPGGGVGDLTLDPTGTRVYFTRGTGTCSGSTSSVPLAGGPEAVMIASPAGSVVTNAVLVGEGGTVAYVESPCAPTTVDATVVLASLGGSETPRRWTAPAGHGVHLHGFLPTGGLLFTDVEPPGTTSLRLLDITGSGGDLLASSTLVRSAAVGCRYDGGATYRSDGRLVVAENCTAAGRILLLAGRPDVDPPTVLWSAPNVRVSSLDYDAAGTALLFSRSAPGADSQAVRLVDGRATSIPAPALSEPRW